MITCIKLHIFVVVSEIAWAVRIETQQLDPKNCR